MVSILLLLTLGLVAGTPTPAPAQSETLTYHLFANKAKVGAWTITRTRQGEEEIYESRRDVVFSIKIKSTRTLTTQRSVFRHGVLMHTEINIAIDGDHRRRITIAREADGYRYAETDKPTRRIATPPAFTNLQLFFQPPAGRDAVFFDRLGAFLPVRPIDVNAYAVRLENGEENRYEYLDGRLVRAVLEDGILHTYVRLRKAKTRAEGGKGKPEMGNRR